VVYVSDQIVALIQDWAGQFGGCGEYWMGRMTMDYFYVQSSEVVAPAYVGSDHVGWALWNKH
jgi:hypothetical protein